MQGGVETCFEKEQPNQVFFLMWAHHISPNPHHFIFLQFFYNISLLIKLSELDLYSFLEIHKHWVQNQLLEQA